jgi:SNF family Na+-dependent transporter
MAEVEKERERWSSKTAFYFTAVGAAVGKARHCKA